MNHKLNSKFENASESPGYQLWCVTNLWQKRIRLALKEFDLTHVQFALLAVLAIELESQDSVNQVRVARAAKTDVMMTSQVLRSLEKKLLVRRKSSSTDARSILVTLTHEGRDLVSRAIKVVEDVDTDFFGILRGEVDTLTRLLNRLSEETDS